MFTFPKPSAIVFIKLTRGFVSYHSVFHVPKIYTLIYATIIWSNILLAVIIIILILFAVLFCCCACVILLRFLLEPAVALCNCTTRLDGKTALVTG
ncbi:unnamed protein product, partial [Leptidea sinapis]